MATFNYPNTSGIVNLTPSTLLGLGITLSAGDTLNIQPGTYDSIMATGLNGASGNHITINCQSGSHFSRTSYTGAMELVNCTFLTFQGIDVTGYTNAIFSRVYGTSHDITWQNSSFKNFTNQDAFQIGDVSNPKAFAGTKASTYYNFKWLNNTFDGIAYGSFIKHNDGITVDCEVTGNTFKNVNAPGTSGYPYPVYFWGYGWKISANTFLNIGTQNVHLACIQFYGYADIYNNIFSNQLANDVRCFPLTLNLSGYTAGKNRFWNNISHDKVKYSMFEINTNNQADKEATGQHFYNPNNEIYFNTAVRTIALDFQANVVDFYCASGIVKGNLILAPETDKTYNSGRNYAYSLDNSGGGHTGAITAANNYQAQTVNPASFNDSNFTPVAGGPILDIMPVDISYITTDFYGNPRKFGSASDAGAVEYQGAGVPNVPPVANAGADFSVQLPIDVATVDGSASTDSDGMITTYLWTKVSGPAGMAITSPNSAATGITGLTAGVFILRLTVTDDDGDTDTDDVEITVLEFVSNINVFGNQPNVVVSNSTISFEDAGITADNMSIIYLVDNPIKSYVPGRAINGITQFEEGKGYYLVPKIDLDLSNYLIPPVPASGSSSLLLTEDGFSLQAEDGTPLILE